MLKHVVAEIHAFFRASLSLGFVAALRRAAKSPSSLSEVVGGRRGGGACTSQGSRSVPSGGAVEAYKVQVLVQVMHGFLTDTLKKRRQSVSRMQSVRDLTSLPDRTMYHVILSRHHASRRGRKFADISSSPSVVRDATISSSLRSPSGSDSFTFRSPATRSLVPLGSSLSAATTLSIAEVSSGAR